MRQTDTLPTPEKCFERTSYLNQRNVGIYKTLYPICVYLDPKEKKRKLNCCVKNTRKVSE